MKPKPIVKKLGGVNAAAAKLDYTPRAIRYWLASGRIPKHAQKIVRMALTQEGK